MNLLKVIPISGVTDEDICANVYSKAIEAMDAFPSLDAIYVSNGFFEHAANAVLKKRPDGTTKVFGHEYTTSLPELINKGIVGATIYQKPADEWYRAILLLNDLLTNDKNIEPKTISAECCILMKETISSVNIGGIHLL